MKTFLSMLCLAALAACGGPLDAADVDDSATTQDSLDVRGAITRCLNAAEDDDVIIRRLVNAGWSMEQIRRYVAGQTLQVEDCRRLLEALDRPTLVRPDRVERRATDTATTRVDPSRPLADCTRTTCR